MAYRLKSKESIPAGIKRIVKEESLKDLETWLAEDHNLVVLREKIVANPICTVTGR